MSFFLALAVSLLVVLAAAALIALVALRRSMRGRPGMAEQWLKDDMPAPVTYMDADGVVCRMNRRAQAFFGLGEDDPAGIAVADLLPDMVAPLFLYHLQMREEEARIPMLFIADSFDDVSASRVRHGYCLTPVKSRDKWPNGYLMIVVDVADEGSSFLNRGDMLKKRFSGKDIATQIKNAVMEDQSSCLEEDRILGLLLDKQALDQAIGSAPGQMAVAVSAKLKKAEIVDRRSRALLVEDNNTIRRVMTTIVEKAGFDVDQAVDGSAAVEKCRSNQYDVILMDMLMPIMEGDAAAKKIRSLPEQQAKNTPIVAVSSSDSEEMHQRAKDAGMDAYLVKPFTIEQLKSVLKMVQM